MGKPAAAKPKATSSKKPRRADLTGSIHEIRDSRKKQSGQRSSKMSNQEEHHNWGSMGSALGSMHFDSISSVTELFNRSKAEAAKRPKMSIQGQHPKRKARDNMIRSSMNPEARKLLNDILTKNNQPPAARDLSRNTSLDLRRSTGSSGSSDSPLPQRSTAQGADHCDRKVSL